MPTRLLLLAVAMTCCLWAPIPVGCSEIEWIGVTVDTHPALPEGVEANNDWRGLLFEEQEPSIRVTVRTDDGKAPTGAEVAVEIRIEEGFVVQSGNIVVTDFKLSPPWRNPENRSFEASYAADPLASGNYEVVAYFQDENKPSEPFEFVVRNGNEDVPTRRAYLRFLAKKVLEERTGSSRMERYKEVMLELATLEPENPAIYDEMGNLWLQYRLSATEALEFYEKARHIARTNLEIRYGRDGDWPEEARSALKRREAIVSSVRTALPWLEADEIMIFRLKNSPQEFRIVERASGRQITFEELRGRKPPR